ncbi:uncharacterized protein LOC126908511 isoform X5 [Daktulosphaira vitifoliae]|nr:uncharacterized protein LOC126908511 isoform X5 [Daktulosphaira vitifoliae]
MHLGCSVCSKYTQSSYNRNPDSTFLHTSQNKFSNIIFDEKETKLKKIKNNLNQNSKFNSQCYCIYMPINKTKTQSKHICSKICEVSKISTTDDSWLNQIINFRRDNWFECHANFFFNDIDLNRVNKLCFLSNTNCSVENSSNNCICLSSKNQNNITINPERKKLNGQKKKVTKHFEKGSQKS